MPKVSVIIPVYKAEQYIERCIQSILIQTLQDFEIILVDDCGGDNSLKIATDMASEDGRIKIICHERNLGPMVARANGYKKASGDYLFFLDSDDFLPTNTLDILYNTALSKHSDIVSGNIDYITCDGLVQHKTFSLIYGTKPEQVYKSMLLNEYPHNLCNKLLARSLFDNHVYDTFEHATNGEDGYLFYQLLQYANRVTHIDECVYMYFQNSGSITNNRITEQGLISIMRFQKLRLQLSVKFGYIKVLFSKYISSVLIGLYAEGYDNNHQLSQLIRQFGLEKFTSLTFWLKNYGFKSSATLFIKKHLKWWYSKKIGWLKIIINIFINR